MLIHLRLTHYALSTSMEANVTQMEGSKEVDGVFPDALREPILRKVQFSTISRIDNLGQYYCPSNLSA